MSNKKFCYKCQCNPCCCCIGPTGPQGATGPTGPTGATGAMGPTGTALGAYGTFLYTNPNMTVLDLGPVVLNSSAEYSNLTFTPGGTTVTINNTGVYRINYSIQKYTGSPNCQCEILVNGTAAPNTLVSSIYPSTSLYGVTTLTLTAGSTVQLTLIGSAIDLRPDVSVILDIIRVA